MMKPPRYWANLLIALDAITIENQQHFLDDLLKITGVEEITAHNEEAVAYLKVDNSLLNKAQLQAVIDKYSSLAI